MSGTGPGPVDDGSILVGTSAALVVVGAFLGWFTVPVGDTLGSIDGIELVAVGSPLFNGLVTTTLATLATVLSLFLPARETVNLFAAIAGVAIELIAVAFVVAPAEALGPTVEAGSVTSLSNVGLGVFLTLLGGLGVLLGGYLSYRR